MATIRIEKNSNFTVLSNHALDDDRLSLKAVGLLCYMLRQPDDWDYTVEWLASRHKDGRDSVRSCLKELEAAGYLQRAQTHDADGAFSHNEYVLKETPTDAPLTGFPSTVKPSTGKPLTGNPTQPNTNIPSTNIPPYSPPKGDGERGSKPRKRVCKPAPDWKPERFNAFWDVYPRGEAKQAAIRAWDALRADDALLIVMGRALQRQLQREDWQRGIGIPYASTWLNQRRWEDLDKQHQPAQAPARHDPLGGMREL